MRRNALLGLTCLLLGGCQFAGNPFDGFGGFLYDTHTFHSNPNLPPGSDETMQRVQDRDVSVAPLLPEPGDVWPGPMRPIPSMQDLQQQDMQHQLPPPNVPATPPPLLFQNETPGTTSGGGGQGLVVPNGNGTSTQIGADGSVQTVPTPK